MFIVKYSTTENRYEPAWGPNEPGGYYPTTVTKYVECATKEHLLKFIQSDLKNNTYEVFEANPVKVTVKYEILIG